MTEVQPEQSKIYSTWYLFVTKKMNNSYVKRIILQFHKLHTDRGLAVAAVELSDVVVLQHGARLVGVQGVELLGAVLSGADRDGLTPARVVVEEVGHVVHLAVHSDPAVVLVVMLLYFLQVDPAPVGGSLQVEKATIIVHINMHI